MMVASHHDLKDTIDVLTSPIVERVTNAAAAAAVAAPLWMPSPERVSVYVTLLAQILGCVWLIINITFKLYDRWRDRRKETALSELSAEKEI